VKIIGESRDRFIIEATRDEASNLVGYCSRYNHGTQPLQVGDEIRVAAMFKQLYELREIDRRLSDARLQILRAAAALEQVVPVIPAKQVVPVIPAKEEAKP